LKVISNFRITHRKSKINRNYTKLIVDYKFDDQLKTEKIDYSSTFDTENEESSTLNKSFNGKAFTFPYNNSDKST